LLIFEACCFESQLAVIPGRAKHEPGIHFTTERAAQWIPGSSLRDAPE
jgi:hypothetical protein